MRIAFVHNLRRGDVEADAGFDAPETVAFIAGALRDLGHEVVEVDARVPVAELASRLAGVAPDLVFNTAVGHRGRCREAFHPQLFEELGLAYTGADAHACTLTLDKHLSKLIVSRAGVPTPNWCLVRSHWDRLPDSLQPPVIVKPNHQGRSKGVGDHGVFEDFEALRHALPELLAANPDGLLVEQHVVGFDVAAAYLAGASPGTGDILPLGGYHFDAGAIVDRRYRVFDYTREPVNPNAGQVQVPAPIPEPLAERIRRYARITVEVLRLRDFGRLDFRVAEDGRVYFLEADTLPSLQPGDSIYAAGALVGLEEPTQLLGRIVDGAMLRVHRPAFVVGRVRPLRVGLVFNLKRVKPAHDGQGDKDAEFDSPATIRALTEALEALGHTVVPLEADAGLLTRVADANIDVAFNIAEGLRGRGRESLVPAVLELLDIPYTGSDPATLAVTLDKSLAKRVVQQAGIHTPAFAVLRDGDPAPDIGWPLFVKPVAEGSSKGVHASSVTHDAAGLAAMVARINQTYGQPALAEAFLPGREFTVGLLGGPEPRVLAPMEILFGDGESLYGFGDKLTFGRIRYECPAKTSPDLDAELRDVARRAFDALGCRDVARIDLRLDAEGRVHFIECNPLPGMTPGFSDLCLAAEAEGVSYGELVATILDPALARRRAAMAARA